MAHLDAIEEHNAKFQAGLSTYKQGINQFSDLTFEEFENTVLMKERSSVQREKLIKKQSQPKYHPDSHDWRDVMGAVKNQGHCGSCWAFGAVGAVEAQWTMAGHTPQVLSEQMLVDCAQGDCEGGWVDDAFDTMISKGGDCTEEDYPYTAQNGIYCKSFTPVVSISGYNYINVKLEGIDTLAESVYNNGPHAVYVYANSNFQRYESGILTMPHVLPTLITMLSSTLGMTRPKDIGPLGIPGPQVGEKMATSEWQWAITFATLNTMLGYHICKQSDLGA